MGDPPLHNASALDRLNLFLRNHEVSGVPNTTHTTMRPGRAYCIEDDDQEELYKVYARVLDECPGTCLHLTEKHSSIGPVVVDLDFHYQRMDGDEDDSFRLQHRCPLECIVEFVKAYLQTVSEYVILPTDAVQAFVFLKDEMKIYKKGTLDVIKDGVHILIPSVITAPCIQIAVRHRMLSSMSKIFHEIDGRLQNTYADVFDKKVITSAPWTMYGGSKPDCMAYALRHIVTVSSNGQEIHVEEDSMDFLCSNTSLTLVKLFSIRNKSFSTPLTPAGEHEIQQAAQAKSMALTSANQITQHVAELRGSNAHEDKEFVRKLVDILDKNRHEDYQLWVEVGICLHNIDSSLEMLDTWIEFSKKSPKFQEGMCETKWHGMRDGNLGMPTLHYWAKHDNPEKYREIIKDSIFHMMVDARSGCEVPVARVVYHMYKYRYKCVSITRKQWYEFRRHRWVACDSGYTLRNKLSEEVSQEFASVADHFERKASKDEENKENHMKMHKQLMDIAVRLQTRRFLDNIMHECCPFFFDPDFESALDEKTHLIGFENGVYDLHDMVFREGRPDDMVTLSTKTKFIHLEDIPEVCDEEDRNVVNEIETFFRQVLANVNVREYFLTMLASFLHGDIKQERFHIFTAGGSNGKSKTIELFERAFGEYCVKLPVALLTQKRAASNTATSEIARTKGKRFACLQEPGEDEKLNIGLLKELSGGDTILARALYKEPVEFKPQFKLVLVCNHLPNVPAQDFGTWRRIRVIQFMSKFCENPQHENEFPVDIDLSRKISKWRKYFLPFLIEKYYSKYAKDFKLTEPQEILSYTNQYKQATDMVALFVDQHLKRSEDENVFTSSEDMHSLFLNKMYPKTNAPTKMTRNVLAKQLGPIIGEEVSVNSIKGFKGWEMASSFT